MDVKTHIRKHIQCEFGHVPEWAYDLLWEEYADELDDRVTWEDDEGEIWVRRMRLILRTANFVGKGWATLQPSASRRGSAPRKEVPNTRGLAELIETWWNVLPERDKRAVEQMWEFGYNVTEVFAREFRRRFTGGHTLSFDEALNWLQHHARMEKELFVDEDPYNIYVDEAPWYGSPVMRFSLTMLPQGTQWWVTCRVRSVVQRLYEASRSLANAWQTTASILINYILTGERTPPRLPCAFGGWSRTGYHTPLLPPYLSAEAVTRIWQAMRFKGNAKSWALRQYWLIEFNSYAEALEAWNLVAPAEWKIGSYRQFYTEWKRAQRGNDWSLPRADGMCRESLEFRLVKSFYPAGFLKETMATVEPPDSVETY